MPMQLRLVLITVVLISLAVACLLRFSVVENGELAIYCAGAASEIVCQVRDATIGLFNALVFGTIALAAAAASFIWPANLVWKAIAMVAAALGLVLYNVLLSAMALAILVLSLARAVPARE
jgi:hypothetical protein